MNEQPIDAQYREQLRLLAAFVDQFLNGDGPKELGFVILMFEFGASKGDDDRVNYISNGNRQDIIVMLRDFLAQVEGRHADCLPTGAPKEIM